MNRDLSPLVAEIDVLRAELGISRWSQLKPWCDAPDPRTCDEGALSRLLERLVIKLVDG